MIVSQRIVMWIIVYNPNRLLYKDPPTLSNRCVHRLFTCSNSPNIDSRTLSRRSVTPRDLSNTGSPAGFPKTRANKRRGMLRIKSAMLSLCLCECGPHSPIATYISDICSNLKTGSIETIRVLTNGDVSNCSTLIQDISPF